MLPGTIEYYKCPRCGTVLCKSLLLSFNSYTTKWSDGTINEPLLYKPDFVRCTACNHFFWQGRQEVIYILPWNYWIDLEKGLCESNPYTDAGYPAAPTVDEYLQAIENGLAESRAHNIYLRKMIWRFFNDRVRKKESPFHTEKEEIQWKENCLALIALLATNRIENLFNLAELYRNLGYFEESLQLLDEIEEPNLQRHAVKLKEACMQQKKQALSFGFS